MLRRFNNELNDSTEKKNLATPLFSIFVLQYIKYTYPVKKRGNQCLGFVAFMSRLVAYITHESL